MIVGACKPAFLTDHHLSLFRLDPLNGSLRNVEDKLKLTVESLITDGNTFQGGHWQDLHRMLGITSGEQVLYVGDHMFSDILRSKRTLGWRTCLIIPELENELEIIRREKIQRDLSLKMRRLQHDLDEYLDSLHYRQFMGENVSEQLQQAQKQIDEMRVSVRRINDELQAKFNLNWGGIFKAGYQDSRFAQQVIDYADLYTSKATNIGLISPRRTFRPMPDSLPHEQLVSTEANDISESA